MKQAYVSNSISIQFNLNKCSKLNFNQCLMKCVKWMEEWKGGNKNDNNHLGTFDMI